MVTSAIMPYGINPQMAFQFLVEMKNKKTSNPAYGPIKRTAVVSPRRMPGKIEEMNMDLVF
jgi:hypothetical protein